MTTLHSREERAREYASTEITDFYRGMPMDEVIREASTRGYRAGYLARASEEGWRPISEAPKDGTPVLCWREGWALPGTLLVWKHNTRLDPPRHREMSVEEREWLSVRTPHYWGDPNEMDDYGLAVVGHGPTHFMPLPAPPSKEHEGKI